MAIGVIDFAAPVGVFPIQLAKAFRRTQTYPILANNYANGESQRGILAGFFRSVWEQTLDLSLTELADLRDFYIAHDGPTIPFYFYDVAETIPLFTPDPLGLAIDGQYIGRFDGAFEQAIRVGRRGGVNLRIVEVI